MQKTFGQQTLSVSTTATACPTQKPGITLVLLSFLFKVSISGELRHMYGTTNHEPKSGWKVWLSYRPAFYKILTILWDNFYYDKFLVRHIANYFLKWIVG